MADKQIYVDPDASGSADGTSWADAYTSLASAETAEDGDITSIGVYYFHCKSGSGTADTTVAAFFGWATDATHYIVVQGGYSAGETGTPGTPENPSSYSSDYYHYEINNNDNPCKVLVDYFRMDKVLLTFEIVANNNSRGLSAAAGLNVANDIRFSNLIIKGISAGTGWNRLAQAADSDAIVSWTNCIFFGEFTWGPYSLGYHTITNCSIYGANFNTGIGIYKSTGTCTVKNTVVFNCDDDFSGTFNSITYCASDDDHSGDSATNTQITQSADDWAALVTDAAGGDFTITDASSELVGAGDGNTGTDIVGNDWLTNAAGAFAYATDSRYWVGVDSSWNDANNWSAISGFTGGAGVPGSINAVIFDSGDVTSCTCDVAIDIASLDVQSTYSGILDFADSAYAHACAGDMTFGGTGTVDCGDSTITCGGNFDNASQGTWIYATSEVILTGTSKTITGSSFRDYYDLTISGTITSDSQRTDVQHNLTIDTGKFFTFGGDVGVGISGTGTLAINGTFANAAKNVTSKTTVFGSSGILSCNVFNIVVGGSITRISGDSFTCISALLKWTVSLIGGGTYDGTFKFETPSASRSITFSDGIIFTGDVEIENLSTGTYTISNNTNDPDLIFQGDLALTETSGTLIWTKGTGTISLEGASNQSIGFNDESVEDIEIDKTSGTVTLTGGVETDSFLLTDGTFDIDGNNLDTIANFTQAADTTINDTTGGGLITIGVNFAINGSSGNECIWNGPDLDITGTAVAHYTTVTDSDATAGTEVTATDNCTDVSGNFGWDFGVGVTLLPIKFNQQYRIHQSGIYRSSFYKKPNIRFGLFEAAEDGLTLTPADIISMTDSILFSLGLNKTDAVTLSDLSIKMTGVNKIDTINLSDTFIKDFWMVKSDLISLSDNLSTVSAFIRSLFDSVSLSDEFVNSIEFSLSDTINLSDNFDSIIALILSLNDSISLSDSLLKTILLVDSDEISLSDALTKEIDINKADTVNISDEEIKNIITNRTENITLSDNFSALTALILALNDTINLSDDDNKEINISQSDSVTLSDLIIKELGLTKTDIITLSDAFSTSADVASVLYNFIANKKDFNFNANKKDFNFNATKGP